VYLQLPYCSQNTFINKHLQLVCQEIDLDQPHFIKKTSALSHYLEIKTKTIQMKNFKTLLIVSLIIDVLQFAPLILFKMGGEMKTMMIEDMGITGLAGNAVAMNIIDTMMTVFGFIGIGIICSIVYALRLKSEESLKTATFLLFITHLFWTLPDVVQLTMGGSFHPPIPVMIMSFVGIGILFYASQKGEVVSTK
tara:strand:+ start:1957 stop:2538 length:582 start_codon:yes stop_codon:yes gene_type:complete